MEADDWLWRLLKGTAQRKKGTCPVKFLSAGGGEIENGWMGGSWTDRSWMDHECMDGS